jgi:predicted nucleic acid-binding protein
MRFIVLDSTPLGLLFTRVGNQKGDECRAWLKRHLLAGIRIIVPEIIDYELRRELLRLGRTGVVSDLDAFLSAETDRFLPLTTASMRLAADLWARSRKQGTPTADPQALDIDVILSAQVLSEYGTPTDFMVATSNVAHLAHFVPAKQWQTI